MFIFVVTSWQLFLFRINEAECLFLLSPDNCFFSELMKPNVYFCCHLLTIVSFMTTLNEEYKCCVTYCSPLASVVCTPLDFNLLLWNHLANWNRAWYECSLNGFLQTFVVVSKEGVSIIYMDFNYVSRSNKGRYILF